MPNLNVNILGRDGNTRAKVTGQEELLVSVGSLSPSVGLATESTLQSVENLSSLILAAIQAGTEYEAALVIDASDVTWLEIRVYNPDSGTFDSPVYYLAGSNTPGTPALPITYINPNTYLAQIVSNTTGLATEVTLGLLEAKDFATETTLLSVDSNAAQLVTNTTSVTRTPNLVRATGSGTIAPLVYDFSVSNVGSANGTILGGTIKPSETLNFTAGALNNSYAAGTISYDGTGTELVIIFNS
jgi:hypothetical protein